MGNGIKWAQMPDDRQKQSLGLKFLSQLKQNACVSSYAMQATANRNCGCQRRYTADPIRAISLYPASFTVRHNSRLVPEYIFAVTLAPSMVITAWPGRSAY